MSAEVGGEVSRRTLSGMRWAMGIAVVVVPLSFFTNTIFAHVSPLVLGQYGAVMLFSGAFQTLAILGGPKLFTLFVPLLDRRERVSFLLTYAVLALGVFLVTVALARVFAPAAITWVLLRFGIPSLGLAMGVAIAILATTFLTHFLFGVLHGAGAAAIARLPIVGFFVAAVLGAGVFHDRLARDPGAYLWTTSLFVFGTGALLAAGLTLRTDEVRHSSRVRLLLPPSFWSALAFTHIETIAGFAYASLAPTFVLIWLDIEALGPLHGALRYVTLFDGVIALLAALLSPALASLDASGMRERAFGQAQRILNATVILAVPFCLVLIFFASDGMAIFGVRFRASADLLRIVSIAAVASPVVQLGGGMLVAFGEYRAYLAMSCVYIVAALGLNLALIPTLGVTGAACAAALGALAQAFAIALLLRMRFGFRVPARALLAVGVLAAAVVVALSSSPGRLMSGVYACAFSVVFAVLARVTVSELVASFRTLVPGRPA